MGDSFDIYQVPISGTADNPMASNFERTVLSDVPREALTSTIDEDKLPERERFRIWGNRGEPDPEYIGDRLLFGTREDYRYHTIATISASIGLDREAARRLDNELGLEFDDPYTHVLILDEVHEVELDAPEFWKVMGYSGFPNDSFSRIVLDRQASRFYEEYDDVEEFVAEIRRRELYPDPDPRADHPFVDRFIDDDTVHLWSFPMGPSDWLVTLRRGIIQLWGGRGDDISEGDIILFYLKWQDDGGKVGGSVETPGIIGMGMVSGRRSKSDRIWWNEKEDVVYDEVLELDPILTTASIDAMARERALFELPASTIREEYPHLTQGIVPKETVDELSNSSRDRDFSTRTISEIGGNGTATFLSNLTAEMEDRLRVVDAVDLPSMLTRAEPPRRSDELRTQLQRVGQVVLHGPPGTGKTYTARRFTRAWLYDQSPRVSERQLRQVTFHPSMAYEDFMEGLTAEATDDHEVKYEYQAGLFKEFYEDARRAYEASPDPADAPRYVMVIDEINRGNLPKIFGEIITQLEQDKRLDAPEETPVRWAHTKDEVTLPPNLYLIGTMNTADRSIALVDAALRRRFSFHSFPPSYAAIAETYADAASTGTDIPEDPEDSTTLPVGFEGLLSRSVHALRAINENILERSDLTKGKQVGHSYLMGLDSEEDILSAWRYDILPLLEEYYFGDLRRLTREVFELESDEDPTLFDESTQDIDGFDVQQLDSALTDLIRRHEFRSDWR